MSMQHHRMNCTPAQYRVLCAILDWLADDDQEHGDLKAAFSRDDKFRSLTADRLAWNRFADAVSPLYGCHVEHEAISTRAREREIKAMLQDAASRVDVAEKVPAGRLF